ncbi:class I SAM-dependent methyltransferase [Desulfosoma sp.]|uniref:class I SAM-dependent methyltransferase n=1 Tax=Desulfosoma sp. TaxID=2603217 RepID=UPI00404925F3
MKDLNHALFSQYARQYHSMARHERLPEDLEKLKRDRLPPWLSESPRDARILDLGCAQGHFLEALRRVGYTRLTGADLSSELLSGVRRLLPETVRLIQADLCECLKEERDESFDVVFLHDVLEHLPRETVVDVLRDVRRVLGPGGRLSVRVPNLAGLSGVFLMASHFTHVTPFTEI